MAHDFRVLAGLASGATTVFGAFAAAAQPNVPRPVAVWAEEDRYVAAESGSARPGKWLNSTSPLAVEPMACLDADYPCRRVVLAIAAQLFKSEVGLNWIGQTICDDPASMMLVVPSIDEQRNWNNTKWQPTLDAQAASGRPWPVFDVVERGRTGSTTAFKRFRGGYLVITTAASSKGLQGRSIKRLLCDEVSEFPTEVGGRGDPIRQAETRGDGHEDFKALHTSTRKELPGCRITAMYEAGDRRQPYVACPDCGHYQFLEFERMQPPDAKGRVTFACAAHGCVIDEVSKPAMLDGAVWLKTYPSESPDNPAPPEHFPTSDLAGWVQRRGHFAPAEGREPSFDAWQAYSKLKSWARLWGEYQEALEDVRSGKDPDALKVFWQQKLNRAWESASDAPDHQKLFNVRGRFVKRRGVVPSWACEIIGVADVQGDRIEWAAYAYGPDLASARFDWGVIDIDPLEPEAWAELALVVGRRFEGEATIPLGFDAFGVDLGGKKGVTERVYRFVRGRHNVYAVKGSSDLDGAPLVVGKRRTLRLKDGTAITVQPHLIGSHGLKSVIYGALAVTLEADQARLPGGLYNPADATHEDFKQLVSETYQQPKTARASARGWWARIAGQANEQLDLAVYARGLAWWRGAFTRTLAEWQALFEARAKTPDQPLPLFAAVDAIAAVPQAETAPNPGGERPTLFGSRKKL